VAVLDGSMPGTGGTGLAARLRADPALAGTRLLLLTTDRPLDPAAAARAGVEASVAKPVRRADLHDALARLLAPSPAPGSIMEATPSHRPPAAAAARGRILVVEDNTTNQMVATGLLAKLGYQPEVVCNGRQAVEAVARNHYVAVLMDCNMPVMDGYEATLAIRASEGEAPRLPIIAMTAGAMTGDRDRCLAVGMDDYVSKPVTVADLERALSPYGEAGLRPAGPAAVDGDQMDALRALDGGDGSFLNDLFGSFLASAAQALPRLAAAVAAGDALALAQEAHRFRGEAATLGATGLVDLCRDLESLDSPLDPAAGAALVARTDAELARVAQALRTSLNPGAFLSA
jgi:CheY-like chemotaxis protein